MAVLPYLYKGRPAALVILMPRVRRHYGSWNKRLFASQYRLIHKHIILGLMQTRLAGWLCILAGVRGRFGIVGVVTPT